MRMMLVLAAGAALSAAAPAAAQTMPAAAFPHPSTAPAWLAAHRVDPRLMAPLAASPAPAGELRAAERRLPAPAVMTIGAVIGCVAGALIMSAGAGEGEKTVEGFNGCILGGSAGIFLGGAYALATGA